MSTVLEIESAIATLSPPDEAKVRDWLVKRAPRRAKTGAELAASWPKRFQLAPAEAEAFANDVETVRRHQSPPTGSAWE